MVGGRKKFSKGHPNKKIRFEILEKNQAGRKICGARYADEKDSRGMGFYKEEKLDQVKLYFIIVSVRVLHLCYT